MLRPSRDRRATRWLAWRIRLFGAGAILAVFGIAADVELLRWAAFLVLGVAAGLSVVAARAARDAGDGDEGSDDEESDEEQSDDEESDALE